MLLFVLIKVFISEIRFQEIGELKLAELSSVNKTVRTHMKIKDKIFNKGNKKLAIAEYILFILFFITVYFSKSDYKVLLSIIFCMGAVLIALYREFNIKEFDINCPKCEVQLYASYEDLNFCTNCGVDLNENI